MSIFFTIEVLKARGHSFKLKPHIQENTMSEQLTSPKKFYIISLLLALIGCSVSLYSTIHHIDVKKNGSSEAICNVNEVFSCDDIAKSEFSEIYNIPLGIIGLGFFFGLAVLCFTAYFKDQRGDDPTSELRGYQVMSWFGAAVSIGLAALSYFQIGALCLTCIGVYVLSALILSPFSPIEKTCLVLN